MLIRQQIALSVIILYFRHNKNIRKDEGRTERIPVLHV